MPKQLLRLCAFRRAHPAPGVMVLRPSTPEVPWQAVIAQDTVPGDGRTMIITRLELHDLLDALEELFAPVRALDATR